MKQILTFLLLCFGVIVPLQADKNYDISLELARSSKVEKIINNINEIVSLTNLYILTTADKAVTKEDIKRLFKTKDALWKNYKGKELSYNIDTDKKVLTIGNILPTTVSKLQKRLFKNNPNIPQDAMIDKDLSMVIPLSSKVSSFISLIDSIKSSLDTTKAKLSVTEPKNTSILWYKPDGNGGITIYDISSGNPVSMGTLSATGNSLSVTVENKADLDRVKARKGSVGFVIKDKKAIKYVYNGTKWINLSGGGGLKTSAICEEKTLGALRYSDKDNCNQFCSLSGGKYEWKCIDNSKKNNDTKKDSSKDDGVYYIDSDLLYYYL